MDTGPIIAAMAGKRVNHKRGLVFGWILAIATMALFSALGFWQLGRAEEKEAMLAAAQQVLDDRNNPLPLQAAGDPQHADAYHWAEGAGVFVPGPAVLLDNQMREGRAGVRAYRLLQPSAESAPLLVELGWLPLPGDRRLPEVALPEGPQSLQGLLVPPFSAGTAAAIVAAQPNGDLLVTSLEAPGLPEALSVAALPPRVLRLDPAHPLGYARDLDILPNTLPPSQHLGYAVQWFGLALTVLATALLLTWRSRRSAKPSGVGA